MQTLLNLLAGVSLLVWGTHLVRTGILRLYGGDLRRILRRSVSRRPAAFFAGLGVTGLIQSSTATALIVASFAGQGLIGTAPALAVMLGADVGTAVVTVLLSFDLSWLAPLLIFIGIVMHLSSQAGNAGRFGQILLGLGLIMFALQWISVAAHPVVQAAGVQVIFASLTGDVALAPDGKPALHVHAVLGRRDGTALAGHLTEARVRPTLEVVLTEQPAHLRKRYDPESGLALIRPDL